MSRGEFFSPKTSNHWVALLTLKNPRNYSELRYVIVVTNNEARGERSQSREPQNLQQKIPHMYLYIVQHKAELHLVVGKLTARRKPTAETQYCSKRARSLICTTRHCQSHNTHQIFTGYLHACFGSFKHISVCTLVITFLFIAFWFALVNARKMKLYCDPARSIYCFHVGYSPDKVMSFLYTMYGQHQAARPQYCCIIT